MSDDDMLPCPVCDTVWGSEEARKGHWGGTQDDMHSGAYHEALQAFDGTQAGAQGSDGSSSNDTADASKDDSGSAGTAAATADGGGGLSFPDAPDDDGGGGGGGGGCPECGGELEDVPAGARVTFRDGRVGTTEQGDEHCKECDGLVSDGEVFY